LTKEKVISKIVELSKSIGAKYNNGVAHKLQLENKVKKREDKTKSSNARFV